jgi:hypothetical protein
MLIRVFSHNLFHKICEESPRATAAVFPSGRSKRQGVDYTSPRQGRRAVPDQVAAPALPIICARSAFSFRFKRLGPKGQRCTHCFPQFVCKAPGEFDKPPCLKNRRPVFFLINQGPLHCRGRLRTILSTTNVQKCGWIAGGRPPPVLHKF